jgi:pimeloyl-ACP methyl ester carboxylesterase
MSERMTEARARLEVLADDDRRDERIDPRYIGRSFLPDDVAPIAVVLLHGLSNAPPQYDRLATQLAARGHAVLVPRLPYHGYRDRLTDALADLRAVDMEQTALEALTIAALCGERVVVLGVSVGAVLAGWVGARTAIDSVIAVSPFCGLRWIPGAWNDALGATLRLAPNRFSWWDPRVKEQQLPMHGYPRFATRALGESLLLSTTMRAPESAAHARRAFVVLNPREPLVNNGFASQRFGELTADGVSVSTVALQRAPDVHDIIEPAIPQARTEFVYPRLIDLIESA